MGFRLEDLVPIFKWLSSLGLGFVIIGDTCIYYTIGRRVFEGDVDLYIYEGSLISVEGDIISHADEVGWDLGSTWLGTPSLVVRVGSEEVSLDLYEAVHDFYVPWEFLESPRVVDISGYPLRMLSPEQHIVLKARSGSEGIDEELHEYVDLYESGDLKISIHELKKLASFFEDQRIILSRLRNAGFPL
ncbi:MAG: nucleotidyltransferase [Desulfurococcales archaeon]|nr:nucleotidyltransferase [Desulfurococcales archaeon]